MNEKLQMIEGVDCSRLVRTLLKIDPGALAALSAGTGSAERTTAAGLHELMRLVLERALSLLWASEDFKLRLYSDASAKALRCNWRIHNLVELFAWALIRNPRAMWGSGELALCPADPKIVHLQQKPNTSEPRWSVDQLVRVATTILQPDFDAIRDAPGPSCSSISIRAVMRDTLGVQPEKLIRLYYETQEAAELAFAQDPEGQALAGLSALLMRVLHHYPLIVDAETDACVLGFRIENDGDYNGADGADGANLGALLTAGLFADGERKVGFVV